MRGPWSPTTHKHEDRGNRCLNDWAVAVYEKAKSLQSASDEAM